MSQIEFPELTTEAPTAFCAALKSIQISAALTAISSDDFRRYLAAFLREAIVQATEHECILLVNKLHDIANNIHSLPPPPPTLAEARTADLGTPDGRATVTAFLATLGEGVQP